MNQETFLKKLQRFIDNNFESQTAAASHYKCSSAYISAVCRGVSPPPKSILKEMGYTREKVVTYKRIKK